MNKKYESIFKKLEMDKIIESEHEAGLYKQVYENLIDYLENNGKATFQEVIKYVNGSDRRTLRMLDQLVNMEVLKFEYPFFTLISSDVTKTRLTPNAVRCPMCDSKMLNLESELKHITEIMKKIYEERFTPTFVFDQRPVNYKTSVRRAGYMVLRGDIRDKRIAVLGDDDLTSITIGLTELPKEIVVFDIDKRVIDYIDELSTKYGIKNIKAVCCDLTKDIPKEYREYFDLFTTDPTPTSKPFTVFTNMGMELLKNEPGMIGYASIYPSCKLKDVSIQKILTSMGLMITDLIPYWTQYEYIKHTYNESDLELEKRYAADQSKISFFEYLLRFETTEESKTLDIDYQLKDIIGTATERVLADPSKDPTLGIETKNRECVEEAAEYLREEISNG